MKRTQVYLPEPMTKKLDEMAVKKGVSRAEIIRRIIEGYLEKKEKEAE